MCSERDSTFCRCSDGGEPERGSQACEDRDRRRTMSGKFFRVFVELSGCGSFGDPKARVIRLNRRSKNGVRLLRSRADGLV
jgi:hypothetical protein